MVRAKFSSTVAWTLVVVLLILSAVLAELALRQLGYEALKVPSNSGWSERDSELGWKNRQNGVFYPDSSLTTKMTLGAGGERLAFNSNDSLNGDNVLFVGGSFIQGQGVNDKETFAYRINEKFPALRVRNFGVGAYGTYQSYLSMEKYFDVNGATQHTSLTIYGLIEDHFRRNLTPSSWVRQLRSAKGGFIVPPHVRLIDGDFEFRDARFEIYWPLETKSALVTLLHHSYLTWRYTDSRNGQFIVMEMLLRKIRGLAASNGSKLLVVYLRSMRDASEFQQAVKRSGVEYIDCEFPELFATGHEVARGHPDSVIHNAYADCITDWMVRNGFRHR